MPSAVQAPRFVRAHATAHAPPTRMMGNASSRLYSPSDTAGIQGSLNFMRTCYRAVSVEEAVDIAVTVNEDITNRTLQQ